MTPLRKEDITLFCEDAPRGLTARLIEAALQDLRKEPGLGFAGLVAPNGSSSKNDVQVWTRFARIQDYRAVGLRDRDFLSKDLVADLRSKAFDRDPKNVTVWPLPRRCIESYLLDADVLCPALPGVDPTELRALVDVAAQARRWLDVARGAVEAFLWQWRQVQRRSVAGRPADRASAIVAATQIAELAKTEATRLCDEGRLAAQVDALAEDMEADGPLRHRVDGKELILDVQVALMSAHPTQVPAGDLLSALRRVAHRQPPAGLVNDLRSLLLAFPPEWRQT